MERVKYKILICLSCGLKSSLGRFQQTPCQNSLLCRFRLCYPFHVFIVFHPMMFHRTCVGLNTLSFSQLRILNFRFLLLVMCHLLTRRALNNWWWRGTSPDQVDLWSTWQWSALSHSQLLCYAPCVCACFAFIIACDIIRSVIATLSNCCV